MKLDRILRAFLGGAIVVVVLAVVAALLFITESAVNVWEQLSQAPAWLWGGYVLVLLALIGGGFWLIWKLLVPRRRALERESERASTEPELRAALDEAAAAGIEVGAARRELDRLAERRSGG